MSNSPSKGTALITGFAVEALATAPLSPAAWPRDDWWTAFNDPQLDALIAEALAESPTLRVAAARTRKALAYAGVLANTSASAQRLDARTRSAAVQGTFLKGSE